MKKSALLIVIIFVSYSSFAQIKFSLQAGIINTNNHVKKGLIGGLYYAGHTGFTFGINVKNKLSRKFISESGIFYNQKGYSYTSMSIPGYFYSGYDHVNYITVDQDFLFRFVGIKQLHFSAGAGAFIAKGVNGNFVQDASSFNGASHLDGKINFGNASSDHFRSWDGGLNFLLRAAYRKFELTGMFSPSFTNHIPKDSQQNVKEKLQSVSLTIGYNF